MITYDIFTNLPSKLSPTLDKHEVTHTTPESSNKMKSKQGVPQLLFFSLGTVPPLVLINNLPKFYSMSGAKPMIYHIHFDEY